MPTPNWWGTYAYKSWRTLRSGEAPIERSAADTLRSQQAMDMEERRHGFWGADRDQLATTPAQNALSPR